MTAAGMRDDREPEENNSHATSKIDRKDFLTSMSAAETLLDKVSITKRGGGFDIKNSGISKSYVAELTNIPAHPNKHSISEIPSLISLVDYREANREYVLRTRQQPIAARVCTFNERDRQIISPPPVLQLLALDQSTKSADIDTVIHFELRNVELININVQCDLWNAELDRAETVMPEFEDRPSARRLKGAQVVSPFIGRDEFGVEACFCLFPDLSCRITGKYRLRFVLYVINPSVPEPGDRIPFRATVLSDVFEVFPPKNFSGQLPTTELTKRLKEQGRFNLAEKRRLYEMMAAAGSNEEHENEDEKSHKIFRIPNQDFEGAAYATVHNGQNTQLSQQSRRSSISNASDVSQASSLYSITDSILSLASASSKSSVIGPQGEQLRVILLSDSDFRLLCVDALAMMTPDRFERNLRRLLKVFGTELRKEADSPYQRSAARFVCYSARNSAHIIRNTFDIKHSEADIQPGFSRITALKPDLERGDEYASDASSGFDGLDYDVPDVQLIKQFIIYSQALASFRVQLRNFVYPEDLKGRPSFVVEQPNSGDGKEEPVLIIKQPLAEQDIKESQPINAYQTESLELMEPAQRPNWKCILSPNVAKYLPNLRSMIAQEPEISTGKARVRWKCLCGEELFDDFTEVEQGGAQRLEEVLNYKDGRILMFSNDSHWTKRCSMVIGSFFNSIFLNIGVYLNLKVPHHWKVNLPRHELPIDSEAQPQGQISDPTKVLYLLICYNEDVYASKLLQISISDLQSDKGLFRILQTTYRSIRGRWWHFISFRTLNGIRFVRFEMYKSQRVDIPSPQKDDEILPPTGHVEYLYSPTPPKVIPPVGENYLKHLFRHPDHAEDDPVCLNRFPKKLREKLALSGEQLSEIGWGLHLSEGWDVKKAWIVGFLVSAIGGALWGILWTVFEHSIQDAFTISAYLVTLAIMSIGFLQAIAGNLD